MLVQSSSAAVLAASSDRLRPHGSMQVSILIQSSSAAVLAASSDQLRPQGPVQVSTKLVMQHKIDSSGLTMILVIENTRFISGVTVILQLDFSYKVKGQNNEADKRTKELAKQRDIN